MTVYPRTVYQTVTNDVYHPVPIKSKKKRWGFGLQAGYGYPGDVYVGAGVELEHFYMVVCFINVEVILIIVGKCAWRFSRFFR